MVRFREHYDKVSYGEELLRKLFILERAIELKTKRENQSSTGKKGKDSNSPSIIDTRIIQVGTCDLFDYLNSTSVGPNNHISNSVMV